MNRVLKVTMWMLIGYVIGGIGGGLVVALFSPTAVDRGVEIAMTGTFVTGPMLAVLVGAWITSPGRRKTIVEPVEQAAALTPRSRRPPRHAANAPVMR